MKYHFIYKTTSSSGKYYIGRHTTNNINDGYFGSGKWVRSIKDTTQLTREILEYCESIEQLLEREQYYIHQHIGTPGCMNFNDRPIGFGSGEYNPATNEEERARRSLRFKQNNPNNDPANIAKRAAKLKGRPSPTKGQSRTDQAKLNISEGRTGIRISDDGRKKLAASRRRQCANGERIIPSFKGGHHSDETKQQMSKIALNREKIKCPHCGALSDKGNYARWHGDKCKQNLHF